MPEKQDLDTIDTARKKFGDKEYARALQIYAAVEDKTLLNDLDKKIIAHCNVFSNFGSK